MSYVSKDGGFNVRNCGSGTLEELVSVLEEVLQEQVMTVSTTNEDEGATQ